jgi:predicted nuclease of restriction endonuclease-like (RecB) superfamily
MFANTDFVQQNHQFLSNLEKTKEVIADYGIEMTLQAMIEVIKDGYILEFYPYQDSNWLRYQLEKTLIDWMEKHNDKTLIDFDYKDAQINEDYARLS